MKTGDKYKVNGTPLHNGHVVTIVDPLVELLKARDEAKRTGRKLSEGPIRRPGLVAAYDPAYPSTLWWWFAPHQLERVESVVVFAEFGPKVPAQTIPYEALESARQSMTRELMKIVDSYARKAVLKLKPLH